MARARRFDPAEQMDTLFDVAPSNRVVGGQEWTKTAARSVAFAACPKCSAERCGLVMQGQHLSWRLHAVRTWGGVSMDCTASGQAVCQLPPRHGVPLDSHSNEARCKHIDWLPDGGDGPG